MPYTEPLSHYVQDNDTPLCFHLIDVGEGLMILITFPDKTTMLFDCNIIADEHDRIIQYLKENIPWRDTKNGRCQWIDIYVNSHRDADHYRGLRSIREEFEIRSIWDSGTTGEATESDEYNYYMRLRRELGDKTVIPVPSYSPLTNFGGADVYCLCSSIDIAKNANAEKEDRVRFRQMAEIEPRIQHTNAIVLRIEYAGRSLLLASDTDYLAWRDKIIPAFNHRVKSDILIASHHGSRSFFTSNDNIDVNANPETTYLDSINYIDPAIVLISCGDRETYGHPDEGAKKIYSAKAAKQVYSTKEKGTLVGFIAIDGRWSICPVRFCACSNSKAVSFSIQCKPSQQHKSGRDGFPIGCTLNFSVVSNNAIREPYKDFQVDWEVSNGGIGEDCKHQEIYDGDVEDILPTLGKGHFSRYVAFQGTHLLRCRVRNRHIGFDATKIFVVRGIK